MEVPMETCPFMSRLYLPRYLFLFCFLPFSLLSLKINVRFGLGNIYGVESKMYCLGTLMWAAPERTAGFSVYISRCCWLKQDTLSQQNWSVYFGNLVLYVKIFTEQFSICKSRCLPSSVEASFSHCPREEAVAEMSCPGASAAKPCAQAVSSVRSTPYHMARWWIGFHVSPGFSYSPPLPALLSSPLWALPSLLVCCLSCSRCGCCSWSLALNVRGGLPGTAVAPATKEPVLCSLVSRQIAPKWPQVWRERCPIPTPILLLRMRSACASNILSWSHDWCNSGNWGEKAVGIRGSLHNVTSQAVIQNCLSCAHLLSVVPAFLTGQVILKNKIKLNLQPCVEVQSTDIWSSHNLHLWEDSVPLNGCSDLQAHRGEHSWETPKSQLGTTAATDGAVGQSQTPRASLWAGQGLRIWAKEPCSELRRRTATSKALCELPRTFSWAQLCLGLGAVPRLLSRTSSASPFPHFNPFLSTRCRTHRHTALTSVCMIIKIEPIFTLHCFQGLSWFPFSPGCNSPLGCPRAAGAGWAVSAEGNAQAFQQIWAPHNNSLLFCVPHPATLGFPVPHPSSFHPSASGEAGGLGATSR